MTEFIRPGPENADLYLLIADVLQKLPQDKAEIETHVDRYYWNFLDFLGLAAVHDGDIEDAVAYDLTSGYITARELAERPAGDFVLPYPWSGIEARKLIRNYLATL